MTTFAVQYLGSRPKNATLKAIRARLNEGFQRLPISMVLLDWDLPPAVEEVVAKETALHNAKLYRWQTWLTGDSHSDLPPEWATIGLEGDPIPGFENEPDFTFICPNHSAVEEFLAERLELISARGLFQGVFLDRIRFPSPAVNPAGHLGCFCSHCRRLAADAGLDLEAARLHILSLLHENGGAARLVHSLFGDSETSDNQLEAFLNFREKSITRTVYSARKMATSHGLAVGLDCYSPTLARMVAQDLTALKKTCDWIKLMTYPRVFGPAGISFELHGLLSWLIHQGLSESEAIQSITIFSGLHIPHTIAELRQNGLEPEAIVHEIQCGRKMGLANLLAGIALVEVVSIHESTKEQIRADLLASRAADGLVLSWDLWQIPLEHLDTIRDIWETQ